MSGGARRRNRRVEPLEPGQIPVARSLLSHGDVAPFPAVAPLNWAGSVIGEEISDGEMESISS